MFSEPLSLKATSTTAAGPSSPNLATPSDAATIAPPQGDIHPPLAPPGYDLAEEIGRGGMGVVYLARDRRLNREVAVKLAREAGPDNVAIRLRFITEARITAGLAHPGIPAVHELGELPGGRPFLAMKLVRGRTFAQLLDESWTDSHSAGEGAISQGAYGRHLSAFEQVCHAVGYAHAHRVIHRDLKPSNVMVGEFGEVQVMDWGLAKVMGEAPGEGPGAAVAESAAEAAPAELASTGDEWRTEISPADGKHPAGGDSPTRTGAVLGTPAYMSPEQAAGRLREIDAKSDVFGLGAILFHILAGRPLYQGASVGEIRRLAMAGEVGPALADLDRLGADPEIVRLCRRCLSPNRDDRPADGAIVAAEVARIRADAEARARRAERERGEALLREKEAKKRRRVLAAAAAAVIVALSAGAIFASIGMRRANIAAINEQKAKRQAIERAKQIERGRDLLASMFDGIDIRKIEKSGQPLEAALAKKLAAAADRLEGESVGDPLLVADLQSELGVILLRLSHPNEALPILERAYRTRAARLGEKHVKTLTSMDNLASAYSDVGNMKEGLPLRERTVELCRQHLGPEHEIALTALNNLAVDYQETGRLADAARLLEMVVSELQAAGGADDPATLGAESNLAIAYETMGDLTRALPLHERVLARSKATLGADHADTLVRMNRVALALRAAGRFEEAIALLGDAYRRIRSARGRDHDDALAAMNDLALCHYDAGHFDEAIELYEGALRSLRAAHGDDHRLTLTARDNLAAAYAAKGRDDLAQPLLEDALRRRRALLGPHHADTLTSMNNLADQFRAARQFDKAIPLFRETLALSKRHLGDDHPNTISCLANLGAALLGDGATEEALPVLEKALSLQEAKLGKSHPDVAITEGNLATAYLSLGRLDDALPMMKAVFEYSKAKRGPSHPATLAAMNNLGTAYFNSGRKQEFLAIFEEAYPLAKKELGAEHPTTLTIGRTLALGRLAARQEDKALELLAEVVAGMAARQFDHEHAREVVMTYTGVLEFKGDLATAEMWTQKWVDHIAATEGRDSAECAGQLAALGENLLKQKKWAEAEAALAECLAIREKLAPEDWRTFNTLSMLGAALLGRAQYADAEPRLAAGWQGLRQRAGQIPELARSQRLAVAADRLIALYEATNRAADADRIRGEKAAPGSPSEVIEPPAPE